MGSLCSCLDPPRHNECLLSSDPESCFQERCRLSMFAVAPRDVLDPVEKRHPKGSDPPLDPRRSGTSVSQRSLRETYSSVTAKTYSYQPTGSSQDYSDLEENTRLKKRYRLGLYDCISSYCGELHGTDRKLCIVNYCHRSSSLNA